MLFRSKTKIQNYITYQDNRPNFVTCRTAISKQIAVQKFIMVDFQYYF